MIWATKVFESEGWYEVQDTFEEQFAKLGAPSSMMLLMTAPEPLKRQLWMTLPSEIMLPFYPGFELVTGPLPIDPGLLVGNVAEFRRMFRTDGEV